MPFMLAVQLAKPIIQMQGMLVLTNLGLRDGYKPRK